MINNRFIEKSHRSLKQKGVREFELKLVESAKQEVAKKNDIKFSKSVNLFEIDDIEFIVNQLVPLTETKAIKQTKQYTTEEEIKKIFNQDRSLIRIKFDALLSDIDEDKLSKIIYELRKISKDFTIEMHSLRPGSIILTIEGSEESINSLYYLYESGNLNKILDYNIQDINIIKNKTSKIVSNIKDEDQNSTNLLQWCNDIYEKYWFPLEEFYSEVHPESRIRLASLNSQSKSQKIRAKEISLGNSLRIILIVSIDQFTDEEFKN